MPTKHYPIAAAFSYAGEDVASVAPVNRRLRRRNISTFFARERQGELWGKDEKEFERIYGGEARFMVPFISKHYVQKEWPRREFRIARREARRRQEEYILPVRLDDTPLPGLRKTVQYVRAAEYSAREIADLIERKLTEANRERGGRESISADGRILPTSNLHLLGLLATASFPLDVAGLHALVPDVNWRSKIASWRRSRLLQTGRRPLELVPTIRREVLSKKADVREYRLRWVEILEPLRGHVDTGLMLALQYAALRQVSEMVDVIVPIAEGLEPGFWNGLYRGFLRTLDKPALFRRLSVADRIRVLNAYGILVSQGGDSPGALAQFKRLRALSKRHRDIWGEGQSYINAGVAAVRMGKDAGSIKWYEKAVALGRKHRDWPLAGRALGNLSTFYAAEPKRAEALLKESERLLARAGDSSGLIGALLHRGYLAATGRDFASAARHYRKAARLARAADLRYRRCVALLGLARTQVDLGRPIQSYPFYADAHRIAAEEGFANEEISAVGGEALARLDAKEFGRAAQEFSKLASLHHARGNAEGEVVAMHDEAIARSLQGRRADAYAGFTRTISEAHRRELQKWVYRSQLDASRVAPDQKTATDLLRRARRSAILVGDQAIALEVSLRLAEHHVETEDQEGILRELGRALEFASPDQQLKVLAYRFHFLLATKRDRRIGPGFRAFRKAALKAKDWQSYVDMHMAIGDHLWRKGGRERVQAYEAYVAAMLKALDSDFGAALKAGAYILRRLLGTPAEDRDRFFDGLERQVAGWLEKQRVQDTRRVIAFSLFPVRVARRVFGSTRGGLNLSGKEVTRMLWEEVRREGTGPRRSARRAKQPRRQPPRTTPRRSRARS